MLQIKKTIFLSTISDSNLIFKGFHFALATGNWKIDGLQDEKTGVAQVFFFKKRF